MNGWRGGFALLALLAILTKAAIPTGFMVEARAGDLGIPLVICTAQGAVTLGDVVTPGHPSPDKKAADSHCVFAGNPAGALGPQVAAPIPLAYADWTIAPAALPADLAPGRGLAAPPPLPARGPPTLRL
ncbi:MAG: hypothetical protein IT546_10860 [Caulobacteraceae bacterium]|nr:hypothetical protein [Caulobacteraceae bacterium]